MSEARKHGRREESRSDLCVTVWREEHVKGRLHPGGVHLQPWLHLHTAAHAGISRVCVRALCVRPCVHPTAVHIRASPITIARQATSSLSSAWINTPERGAGGGRGGKTEEETASEETRWGGKEKVGERKQR